MFSERFGLFIIELMENEGWTSNDPFDSGGHTIVGITQRSFPMHHDIIMNMIKKHYPKEKIIFFIKTFYFIYFYNPLYDHLIDSSLSFKIFDFGVNAGISKSIKILQKTSNLNNVEQLKVDGKFGTNTLRIINSFGSEFSIIKETEFYDEYTSALGKYYKSLWNFFRFGQGWMNRLKRVFNKEDALITRGKYHD